MELALYSKLKKKGRFFMKKTKQIISVVLCVLLAVSMLSISASAKKAKKYVKSIKVSKKATLTIPAAKKTVSKSFKVTVKVSGKASKKFTAKSSKPAVASVKVKGSKINVTAKSAGKTVIKVTTKAKNKKKKALTAKLTLTVKKALASTPAAPVTPPASTDPTAAPVEPTPAPQDPTPAPVTPTAAPQDPTPAPVEPTQASQEPKELSLTTTVDTVTRQASSGKDGNGNEQVVDIQVNQAKSVFSDVPVTADELKSLHKADALLPNEQDAALNTSGANGRFEVVALYFAALKAYDPNNPEITYAMMEELCESPTTKINSIDSFNNFSRSAMKDNMSKTGTLKYKYKYLGNSYFDGADQSNGYTPSTPLTVTLEDYVYSSEYSNQYQTYIYKITSRFAGADSERIIQVYQDTIDGKWYIFSDSWKGFTADIKEPALKYIAQWQAEEG